jgi:hypothetical protein
MAALPMFVPPILGMIGSAWFMVAAHQARTDGRCRLDLPWSAETSARIVQDFHLAAWIDIERLARLSSECIAQLHTDVVASYLVVWALTCVPSIVLMIPVTPVVDCSDRVVRKKVLAASIAIIVLGAAMLWLIHILLSYSNTFWFEGVRRRPFTVDFNYGHIDSILFWIYFQMKGLTFAAALWLVTGGLRIIWHCGGSTWHKSARRTPRV